MYCPKCGRLYVNTEKFDHVANCEKVQMKRQLNSIKCQLKVLIREIEFLEKEIGLLEINNI